MLPVVVLVPPPNPRVLPTGSELAGLTSSLLVVSSCVCVGMNGHIIHSDALTSPAAPHPPLLTLYTAFCSCSFSFCSFHSSEDNSMSSQWYNSNPPPSALLCTAVSAPGARKTRPYCTVHLQFVHSCAHTLTHTMTEWAIPVLGPDPPGLVPLDSLEIVESLLVFNAG